MSVSPQRQKENHQIFRRHAPRDGGPWVLAVLASVLFLVAASTALAQQEPPVEEDLDRVYLEGITAFNSGDYPTTIAKFNKLTGLEGEEAIKLLETVFFNLAVSYFNTEDYQKAAETFQLCISKYPKHPRTMEATFGLAKAQRAAGDVEAAILTAKKLDNDPTFREQALLFQADALKSAGRNPEVIAVLESMLKDGIKTKLAAKGAVGLTSAYFETEAYEKATKLFWILEKNRSLIENLADLNILAVGLGDKLLASGDPQQALACYRAVRTKDELIIAQRDRISWMENQIRANLVAGRENTADLPLYVAANNQLRTEIENASKILAEFEKLPSMLAGLRMRMARCYLDEDRPWEAMVFHGEILRTSTDPKEREPAKYAMLTTLAEVGQTSLAQRECEDYLKEFPEGANAGAVSYIRGLMAFQAQDYQDAENWFGSLLEKQPNLEMRDQIRILIGNAMFSQGKYEEAMAVYRKYLDEYPAGANAEEAEYRIAMAQLFAGKYEEAFVALNSYAAKFPTGSFVEDAKYRIAVCKYAAQDYDEVIALCRAWQQEYPGSEQLGEVYALLGDAFAATEQTDEALAAYTEAYQRATSDEVLNYAIFEASNLLQKRGDWEKVSAMFEEFVRDKPGHPTALAALFWIGKAKARMGKVDEAKQFLADTIKKYIDDPSREAVEPMLTQLVQLCVRKQRPASPASAPTAGSTPSATPDSVPVLDPEAEVEKLIGSSLGTATAKSRGLFARSEMARMRKQPAEQENFLRSIVDSTKPEELSPTMLGQIGDFILGKGDLDNAAKYYTELRDSYPKSDVVDFAYAGLGEIAYRREDYQLAYKIFNDGTDKIAASQKLRDITLGRGKALLALGRHDEAKKSFEQVASVREWRGEATAESVYSLGEIEWKQGRWAEANAYFQRVFVAYRKYLPWMAKAYVKSADCFEKLGKPQEARNTYNELLRQESLSSTPEAEFARRRLQELGQG